MTLGAGTTLLGVLGWPVGHSLSPLMQGAALAALGLDWAYAAFAVPPSELAAAVRGARALGFRGVNITIPHKEEALALCEPDELARRVGAVNTLRFDPDATRGSNTDVHGFTELCRDSGAALHPGGRAVVLGAGGAARAVVVALRAAGAEVVLASRQRRELLVDGARLAVLPLSREALSPHLPGCDVLVDTTPRGLPSPGGPAYPELDLHALPERCVVLDLTVRDQTPLVAQARARGLRAQAGAAMLLHQGEAALSLWLGREVPGAALQAMRAALGAALAQ